MKNIFLIPILLFIFSENILAQESNKIIFTLHDESHSSYPLSIAEPLDGMFNNKTATFKQIITDNADVEFTFMKQYPAIVVVEVAGRKFDIIMCPNTFRPPILSQFISRLFHK